MRRTLVAVITAVSATVMISGASVAAASASPARAGIEHVRVFSNSATSNKSRALATGLFTARGVDVKTGPRTDTFKFPGGTFRVKHHAVRTKRRFTGKTCLFTDSERGTYTIGGGTGTYARIRGFGSYVANAVTVAARNSKGKCSLRLRPAAFHLVITARGPVKL
jgi:hypothetical protein